MRLCFGGRDDVSNNPVPARQRIGDQRAVTAPRDSLGAHDRAWVLSPLHHELFQCIPEFCRLHIGDIAAETGIAPSVIDRILPSLSKSPKCGHVEGAETGFLQALGQSVRIELRVVS